MTSFRLVPGHLSVTPQGSFRFLAGNDRRTWTFYRNTIPGGHSGIIRNRHKHPLACPGRTFPSIRRLLSLRIAGGVIQSIEDVFLTFDTDGSVFWAGLPKEEFEAKTRYGDDHQN